MPAAFAAFKSITGFLNLKIDVSGANALKSLGNGLQWLRGKFAGLSVQIILIDRLIQSLTRAWKLLNHTLGVQRLAEWGEQISRISIYTGIGTSELQAFAAASATAGLQLDDVADLLSTVAERIVDLRRGENKDFAKFGMSAADFEDTTDALSMVIRLTEKLYRLEPTDRLAAAEKIIGGDLSRRYGQILGMGEVRLRRLMREMKAAGAVLSEQQIELAEKYAQTQRRLGMLFTAVSNNIGAILVPSIEYVFEVLGTYVASVGAFLRANADEISAFILGIVKPIVQFIRAGFDKLQQNKDAGDLLTSMARAIALIAVAVSMFDLMPVIGMMTLAYHYGMLLIFVVDDLFRYLTGQGSTVLEDLLGSTPALQILGAGLTTFLDGAKSLLQSIGEIVEIIVSGPLLPWILVIGGLMAGLFGGIMKYLGETLVFVTQLVSWILDAISYLLILGGALAAIATWDMEKLGSLTKMVGGAVDDAVNGRGPTLASRFFMGDVAREVVPHTTNTIGGTTININSRSPAPTLGHVKHITDTHTTDHVRGLTGVGY